MILLEARVEIEGLYKIEAVKLDGTRRLLADWFANTISNTGLDLIAQSTGSNSIVMQCCVVGSGTTPPDDVTFTQGTITTPLKTLTTTANATGAQVSAPYYGWWRRTFQFIPTGSAYNASEVGVGRSDGALPSQFTLFSRQLIVDGLGDPLTISVLADEYLDVTYELRIYPPLEDVEFALNITGTDPITHDCVLRATNVTTATFWGSPLQSNAGMQSPDTEVTSGTIGAITSGITGSHLSGSPTATNAAYSVGSYKRRATIVWGITAGNSVPGISAMYFIHSHGAYQVSFDPPILKDSNKILTLVTEVTWARRILLPGEL